MDEKQTKRNSKFLSLILRHQPEQIQVALDEEGWLEISVLIANAKKFRNRDFSMEMIDQIVAKNDKQRFSISPDGKRIRANQGHSLNSIDLGFEPITPPDALFHGTVAKFLPDIKVSGLKKMDRNHVHLSANLETATAVGARRGKPVILSIDAKAMTIARREFYLSENGVWLTDHVAPEFIRFPNDRH